MPTIERVNKNCTYIGLISHAILLASKKALSNIYEGFYGGGDPGKPKVSKKLIISWNSYGIWKVFFIPIVPGSFEFSFPLGSGVYVFTLMGMWGIGG